MSFHCGPRMQRDVVSTAHERGGTRSGWYAASRPRPPGPPQSSPTRVEGMAPQASRRCRVHPRPIDPVDQTEDRQGRTPSSLPSDPEQLPTKAGLRKAPARGLARYAPGLGESMQGKSETHRRTRSIAVNVPSPVVIAISTSPWSPQFPSLQDDRKCAATCTVLSVRRLGVSENGHRG